MSLRRRKCILKGEAWKHLDLSSTAFKEYSRSSCLLECRDKVNKVFFKLLLSRLLPANMHK